MKRWNKIFKIYICCRLNVIKSDDKKTWLLWKQIVSLHKTICKGYNIKISGDIFLKEGRIFLGGKNTLQSHFLNTSKNTSNNTLFFQSRHPGTFCNLQAYFLYFVRFWTSDFFFAFSLCNSRWDLATYAAVDIWCDTSPWFGAELTYTQPQRLGNCTWPCWTARYLKSGTLKTHTELDE